MLIKEFATKYKLTNDTVRYYEKEGLLKPIRLENGYRFYDETCGKNIEFTLVLKQLGFSLQEIKILLKFEKRPISYDCNIGSTAMLKDKISDLEKKVEFYSTAIQTLQVAFDLTEKEKFLENKEKVYHLIQEMYKNIDEGI